RTSVRPQLTKETRRAPAQARCNEIALHTSGGTGRATLARFTVETRDGCCASRSATRGAAAIGCVSLWNSQRTSLGGLRCRRSAGLRHGPARGFGGGRHVVELAAHQRERFGVRVPTLQLVRGRGRPVEQPRVDPPLFIGGGNEIG